MTPEFLLTRIVRPMVDHLGWPQPREREVLLVAIAIQESELKYRRQHRNGPARSLWQIEPTTALDCLVRCSVALEVWESMGFKLDANAWSPFGSACIALQFSDVGACAIAAGILRITPGRLPEVGDQDGAFAYYLKAWRPGVPRKDDWPASYRAALA
jgi:hypothetical protein